MNTGVLARSGGSEDTRVAFGGLVNGSKRRSAPVDGLESARGWPFLIELGMIKYKSQAKWAEAAGISPGLLSQIISRKKVASYEVVIMLCKSVGLDSAEVFFRKFPGVRA
jgi:hypothetical protein